MPQCFLTNLFLLSFAFVHAENVKNAMEKVIEKYWEFGIEKKMAFGRSRQWTLNGSVWDNNYYGKWLSMGQKKSLQ